MIPRNLGSFYIQICVLLIVYSVLSVSSAVIGHFHNNNLVSSISLTFHFDVKICIGYIC